jgi:hypothetical protein
VYLEIFLQLSMSVLVVKHLIVLNVQNQSVCQPRIGVVWNALGQEVGIVQELVFG